METFSITSHIESHNDSSKLSSHFDIYKAQFPVLQATLLKNTSNHEAFT